MDVATITRKRELLAPNDERLSVHRRRDETIVGKRVDIGAGQVCDKFYSCTFKDCEIRLVAAGRLVGVATHGKVFEDCLISASKKQIIPTWEATFTRCYFRGKYAARFAGPVVDCDFSSATLLSATFLQAESLGCVVWPKWPHVVIDSPTVNYEDWSQIEKPGDFNRFIVDRKGSAVVFNMADAVEEPEEFWELIRHKGYVHATRTA